MTFDLVLKHRGGKASQVQGAPFMEMGKTIANLGSDKEHRNSGSWRTRLEEAEDQARKAGWDRLVQDDPCHPKEMGNDKRS